MRLKLDENLGHGWADRLRAAGHDVETVHDEGLSGARDHDVAVAAASERRVLVTLDRDFANPFRFPPSRSAGIIVLRVHDRPGRRDLDAVLGRLLAALPQADPTARLWIVDADRVRQYEERLD